MRRITRLTLADVQETGHLLLQAQRVRHSIHCNAEVGEPIGYAQSYIAFEAGTDGGGKKKPIQEYANRPVNMNASQLGKGLGTKLVRALVELLFNDPEVTKIQTDPSPSNLRAIRCYEKAGFERQGTVTTQMVQPCTWFKHARHSSEHAAGWPNPSHRGDVRRWRLWPPLMSNVKHHEGSGSLKYRLNYQR